MSGPERPSSSVAPRPAWSPDSAVRGVTCPVCGLTNESGARVCRNCGLPIASATDPLRGVAPGRIDIVSARRSGMSATLGLVLVVGLLLVSGTLAVSGGGILSGGGRLGVAPATSASASPEEGGRVAAASPGGPVSPATQVSTTIPPREEMSHTFAYTCGTGAIRDATRTRWNIARFLVGAREEEGYDRITFELTRRGGKPEEGTVASIEWMDPGTARDELGISRIAGERALVVTFEGPIDVTANQVIDRLFLDREGVEVVRAVNMFEGADGTVRAVVGVNGESCAKMSAPRWKSKEKGRRGKVFLDVERL